MSWDCQVVGSKVVGSRPWTENYLVLLEYHGERAERIGYIQSRLHSAASEKLIDLEEFLRRSPKERRVLRLG